jgi:gas vesicle protein
MEATRSLFLEAYKISITRLEEAGNDLSSIITIATRGIEDKLVLVVHENKKRVKAVAKSIGEKLLRSTQQASRKHKKVIQALQSHQQTIGDEGRSVVSGISSEVEKLLPKINERNMELSGKIGEELNQYRI